MNLRHSLLPTFLIISSLTISAADNPFVGMWQPDMEATMEQARNNPKFKSADAAQMEKILPQLIGPMRMEFTQSDFTMKFGKSRQQTAPYTVETVSDSKAVLLIDPPKQEKKIRATLTQIGENRITLQIEGNNDMNIYVWRPTKSMDADDPNMAAITAGVLGAGLRKASEKEADQVPDLPVEELILKNLRAIASGANQYMLENGVAEVSFADLKGEYFKPLRSANGENYKDIVIKARQESISVTDKDGKTHTLKLR